METPAALLILLVSIAIAVVGGAFLAKRHRAKWRTLTQTEDNAYRGSVEERIGVPISVRVAVGMSVLMAALCAFRIAASVDDMMNLADGPHIRLQLVPGGMYATITAAILMVTAAGAIPRLLQSGRDLARRSETVAPERGQILLLLSISAATVLLFAIGRVPIVAYWQRRMILYLVVHVVLAAATIVALRSVRRAVHRR